MIEQTVEREQFEVFAWGQGFVGARPTLAAARLLGQQYEGARILTYEAGAFRVVAELGRFLSARASVGER